MMSTMEELLMSAEYILSHGNDRLMLCERGIRTFETYTRNTLDINAVPMLKKLSHLPVVVDPSHGTGKWDLVCCGHDHEAKIDVVKNIEGGETHLVPRAGDRAARADRPPRQQRT